MTTTADKTRADVLDDANLNNLADILALVKLGTMLTPQKQEIIQASGTAVTLDPPALSVHNVRITAGAAAAGVYRVTDVGGTPVNSATLGVCTLSDDGATLTFDTALTEVTVQYMPRSDQDLTVDFNVTGQG